MQDTVRSAPVPPDPVPVHCAILLPGLVQLAVYVVDWSGVTETFPDIAPPVVKLLPVQLVAFVLDHVSVDGVPCVTDVGLRERAQVGGGLFTVQLAWL